MQCVSLAETTDLGNLTILMDAIVAVAVRLPRLCDAPKRSTAAVGTLSCSQASTLSECHLLVHISLLLCDTISTVAPSSVPARGALGMHHIFPHSILGC